MGTEIGRVAVIFPRASVMLALFMVMNSTQSSCAAAARNNPGVEVRIQDPGAAIPSSCVLIGEISASDGRLSRWPWPINFAGEEERAIGRLKKTADSAANLIVLDPAKTVEEIGLDASKGSVITVFGSAYACDQESGNS